MPSPGSGGVVYWNVCSASIVLLPCGSSKTVPIFEGVPPHFAAPYRLPPPSNSRVHCDPEPLLPSKDASAVIVLLPAVSSKSVPLFERSHFPSCHTGSHDYPE